MISNAKLPHIVLPIGWPSWLYWIAACAAAPALHAIADALTFSVFDDDPASLGLNWLVALFVILGAAILPLILQGIALRRVIPSLALVIWFVGGLAAYTCCAVVEFGAGKFMQSSLRVFNTTRYLYFPAYETFKVAELLKMAWGHLLILKLTVAIALALIPAWILGKASGRKWYWFLIAAVAASAIASIANEICTSYFEGHFSSIRRMDPLGQVPLLELVNELFIRATVGAIWGATASLVLAILLRRAGSVGNSQAQPRSSPCTGMMFLAIALIAVSAPLFHYLTSEQGIQAGVPALRKLLSRDPAEDQSDGEGILRYSHNAALTTARWPPYPIPAFAPDGKSFVLRPADDTLRRIAVATGANLGEVAGKLERFESVDFTWSPDARYFVVRTNGKRIDIPNSHYVKHQGLYRLYELPDYKLIGEYVNHTGDCPVSSMQSVAFETDSKSIWVLCAQLQSPTKRNEIMAIQLAVPTLKVLTVRPFGDAATNGSARGMHRFGDSIQVWQQLPESDSPIRFYDLTRDMNSVALHGLSQRHLAGDLTLQELRVEEGTILLRYCGNASGVSNPSVPDAIPDWVHSFCRLLYFDARNGVFAKRQDSTPHLTSPDSASLVDVKREFRIQAAREKTTKEGRLAVHDYSTKQQRQRIVTIAQQPLAFSSDGAWLITHTLEDRATRVYRVER